MLTDRGTEYCGTPEHHEYELYLALEDIDHSRTKAKSPQTNGIVERFHKTVLDEFYRVVFRKKIYAIDRRTSGRPRRLGPNLQRGRPHQGDGASARRRCRPSLTRRRCEGENDCSLITP